MKGSRATATAQSRCEIIIDKVKREISYVSRFTPFAQPQPFNEVPHVKHLLSINGLDGPLARILGCDCGRCTDPTRQAHTSASLISLDEQSKTVHHILFDLGLGVAESVLANPFAGQRGPAGLALPEPLAPGSHGWDEPAHRLAPRTQQTERPEPAAAARVVPPRHGRMAAAAPTLS